MVFSISLSYFRMMSQLCVAAVSDILNWNSGAWREGNGKFSIDMIVVNFFDGCNISVGGQWFVNGDGALFVCSGCTMCVPGEEVDTIVVYLLLVDTIGVYLLGVDTVGVYLLVVDTIGGKLANTVVVYLLLVDTIEVYFWGVNTIGVYLLVNPGSGISSCNGLLNLPTRAQVC